MNLLKNPCPPSRGKGASRTQEVEIFFNFVGKVEIPHEEIVLTEEEKRHWQSRNGAEQKSRIQPPLYGEKRRQWREQREREQEQKPHELPPVADKKGEKAHEKID